MNARILFWILFFSIFAPGVYGQDLVRDCIDVNDQGEGLSLAVDGLGKMHLSHGTRVQGNLRYTVVDVDGSVVHQSVANRLHRFPTSETLGTGIMLNGDTVFLCFHNQLAQTMNLAARTNGVWQTSIIESNVAGDGCAISMLADQIDVLYEANGNLRWAKKIGDGQWTRQTVDGSRERVGVLPSVARSPNGNLVVAYRDMENLSLKVALSSADGWQIERPVNPFPNGGHNARVVAVDDEFHILHGVTVGQLDVESDGTLLQTIRGADGQYVTAALPDYAVGGSIGAAFGSRGFFGVSRHLSRSALFGDSDGLYIFSGTPLVSQVFEQYGPAQGRHTYRYTRLEVDPFGLPITVFVDSFSGTLGNPGGAPICYWRPRDSDLDRVPDEIEAELGTDPDVPDTDGDGRTDGEEVLVDGTDPLVDDVCRPLAEACNGQDDDCDGRTDEDVSSTCYDGPNGTANQGICRAGVRLCENGAWQTCEGQITPQDETCDLTDEDCDGRLDEEIPGLGSACSTGLAGVCGDGVTICFAGAERCRGLVPGEAETCNGLDDDCDDTSDEGSIQCGQGVCLSTVDACLGGIDNICSPRSPLGDDSSCNGLDDDCDGEIDESVLGQETQCGVGACQRRGLTACVDGFVVDQCQPGISQPDSNCDGIDDDCDGRFDEGHVALEALCGVGACERGGQRVCQGGALVDICTPGQPLENDAICDGIDSDCDGRLDEDSIPQAIECGFGACRQPGQRLCRDGGVVDDCEPLPGRADDDCNGADDDCDGRIDEAFVRTPTTCGIGACQGTGTTRCDNGVLVEQCTPDEPQPDDNCDGSDDDCDGEVDEAYGGVNILCGVGACERAGQRRCLAGQLFDDCQAGEPGPLDRDCDGEDTDCDGTADEAFEGTAESCGIGACRTVGLSVCIDGRVQGACVPGVPEANDWICDGVDEDCDGNVDEDYVATPTVCGTGDCASQGEARCQGGVIVDTCAPGAGQPDDTCNLRDEDCDGATDEGFVVVESNCGVGICAADGQVRCFAGQVIDTCRSGLPVDEDTACDGIDTDCDGASDEAYVSMVDQCGVGVCRNDGAWVCDDGRRRLDCTPGAVTGADDDCDGLDDDCDGRVDESFLGQDVQCGVGACLATGETVCRGGVVDTSCTPGVGAENDSFCDGVDEDCDGRVDEDFEQDAVFCGIGGCRAEGVTQCLNGRLSESCEPDLPAANDSQCDGIDDDCDGQSDEDYNLTAITCGLGACVSNGVRTCRNGRETEICESGQPLGPDFICDGIDQDCDGRTDEEYVVGVSTCGVGACLNTGTTQCLASGVVDVCEPGLPEAAPDRCDGVDNDCDGQIDEDHVSIRTACGVGACSAFGRSRCIDGQLSNSCQASQPAPDDGDCDGVDTDCDGVLDEDYVNTATTCGVGNCAQSGERICLAGRRVDTCEPGQPSGNPDVCDGLDDDCDGRVDEDFTVTRTRCSRGVCASSGRLRCIDGAEVDDCTPGAPWGGDSACDGVDADCDGRYDERYRSVEVSCGVGICATRGQTGCQEGQLVDDCRPGSPTGPDTTCDGVDDDCDGSVDESYVPESTRCGIGICQRQGSTRCVGGIIEDTCVSGDPQGSDSACDGVDADCDGRNDERYVATPTTCGQGVCLGRGILTCQDGRQVDSCDLAAPTGVDAECDGEDEDCDGRIDEAFPIEPTRCGQGACARVGIRRCQGGRIVDTCLPAVAIGDDITCDGVDQDCDGRVDEAVPRTASICGVGTCRTQGQTLCVSGRLVSNCRPRPAAPDDVSCDGLDSDCDGRVDEDFTPDPLECGVGSCQRQGITQCFDGDLIANCRPGPPALDDRVCDGVDSDCDGQFDEDHVAQPVECGVGVCAVRVAGTCIDGQVNGDCRPLEPPGLDDDCDGQDGDCDGRVDEAAEVPVECGVGACRRQGRSTCEDGQRVEVCTPGPPAAADPTCDGIDDDCDHALDEDCPFDAGVSFDGSTPSDAAVIRDMEPNPDDSIRTDVLFDGMAPADGASMGDVQYRDQDIGASEDGGFSDADPFGSQDAQSQICLADADCEDLGGAELTRSIRDGCDCAVTDDQRSFEFIGLMLFLIGTRIQRKSRSKPY